MKKSLFILVLIASTWAFSKSYLPSGCGTYILCKETKNDKGELNGPQLCTNAKDDKIKVIEATWKNDLLVGNFFCANDDGIPKVKAQYKDGELDGVYEEYNSSLKQWGTKAHYKKGLRSGVTTRLLSDGRKQYVNYVNDKQHGYQVVVDSSGKVLSKNGCEIEGKRRDPKECDRLPIPGLETATQKFDTEKDQADQKSQNRLVETKNAKGQVISRYKLVAGKTEGKLENFHPNGKPSLIANYIAGKVIDEKTYFEDGQIQSEIYYTGHWPSREIQYYQNGKTKSEISGQIKGDLETFYEFKNYHDNGQLNEVGSYVTHAFDNWRGGRMEGAYKRRNEKGETLIEGTYKQGKRQDLWVFLQKDQRVEQTYKEDVLLAETLIDKATGKKLRVRQFMPDGSTKSDEKFPGFKED